MHDAPTYYVLEESPAGTKAIDGPFAKDYAPNRAMLAKTARPASKVSILRLIALIEPTETPLIVKEVPNHD